MTAIASSAQTFTTLHGFNYTDGSNPKSPLFQASDGNLYGTTVTGGTFNAGTIFRVTPAGTFTLLQSFSSESGPIYSALIQASDGKLYGTTQFGGSGGYGTVFSSTLNGTVTTLYSFMNGTDGRGPAAGLVQGADGNFYGTTAHGGPADAGTVFKLTPTGALTTLHTFIGSDGAQSYGTLVQDAQGNLYGTTSAGGANGFGTVFKITITGVMTSLHDFNSNDGASPIGGVIQARDGNLYGTTLDGGANHLGTVFRIGRTGAFIVLHSFSAKEGRNPYAPLIQATDANFYGTTLSGGSNHGGTCFNGCGTIFRISASGVVTPLISFGPGTTGSTGSLAGLFQATNGRFYGVTLNGGSGSGGQCYLGCGTIFGLLVGGGAHVRAGSALLPNDN